MTVKPPFDVVAFADQFIPARIRFFEKDMRICLRTYHTRLDPKTATHAYFPALMMCLANLDMMGQMQVGQYSAGTKGVKKFITDFMDTSVYTDQKIDLLWECFRHKVAHLAHPQYVFDTRLRKNWHHKHMRITWFIDEKKKIVHEATTYPHLFLRQRKRKISSLPRPYNVPYDHIVYISLVQLKKDIQAGMQAYLKKLKVDIGLQTKFEVIIRNFFPV